MLKLQGKQVACLIVASAAILFSACDETPIEPGNFEYPINLTTEVDGSIVHLSWDEVRVSTFEEYIIVRSTEPIDDTPEPETDGFTVIAARIDDLTVTTFEDSGAPISTAFYYKVYAKIGERFLYSPTVYAELELQLLSMRADNFTVDTAANEILAYDRSLRVLFAYDYQSAEVIHQLQLGINYNNPIIRYGTYQGKEEIYMCDRDNYIRILERSTFQQWNQIFSSSVIHDFQYVDGYLVATRNVTSNGIVTFDRATLFQHSTEDSYSQYFRVIGVARAGSAARVYEFGGGHAARFLFNDGSLQFDRIIYEANTLSQQRVSYAPGLGHFAFSGDGKIYDEDLTVAATLDNALSFHQVLAYADDSSRLFSVGFELNTAVIRTYLPMEGYDFLEKRKIGYTPTLLFADEGYLYAVGLAFINNTTRTVITREAY